MRCFAYFEYREYSNHLVRCISLQQLGLDSRLDAEGSKLSNRFKDYRKLALEAEAK